MKKYGNYIDNSKDIIYLHENRIFAKDKPIDRIYLTVDNMKNCVFPESCISITADSYTDCHLL